MSSINNNNNCNTNNNSEFWKSIIFWNSNETKIPECVKCRSNKHVKSKGFLDQRLGDFWGVVCLGCFSEGKIGIGQAQVYVPVVDYQDGQLLDPILQLQQFCSNKPKEIEYDFIGAGFVQVFGEKYSSRVLDSKTLLQDIENFKKEHAALFNRFTEEQ